MKNPDMFGTLVEIDCLHRLKGYSSISIQVIGRARQTRVISSLKFLY